MNHELTECSDDELMDVNYEEIEFIEDRASDTHKVFRVFNPNKRLGNTRTSNTNSTVSTLNHRNTKDKSHYPNGDNSYRRDTSTLTNLDKSYGKDVYRDTYGKDNAYRDAYGKDRSYNSSRGDRTPVRGKRDNLPRLNDYSDFDRLGINDEWTVLDNYTNIDGSCEQYTYVEKTVRLNTFILFGFRIIFFQRKWTFKKANLFH